MCNNVLSLKTQGDYKVDCVNIILESASILKDS